MNKNIKITQNNKKKRGINMLNKITKKLQKAQGQQLTVIEEGFIKSKFQIQNLQYSIKEEILQLEDKEKSTYIEINLNQVYKVNDLEEEIGIFLDNDMKIILK